MHFCREKYKLYLSWDKIDYHNDSVANLVGAKFSGQALSIAKQIQPNDSIDLDLTPQHFMLFDSYYIVSLFWGDVSYNKDNSVTLKKARLENNHLKSLHKLTDSDFILINTEKHEESTHAFHLVYDSTVMREDKTPYRYNNG